MNKHIVFLISHIPNPRINKRIALAKECGRVCVICTRRKSQNIWEPVHTDAEHYILDIDLPSSKHLLKRFVISRKYQKTAYNYLLSLKPDIIYVEGLDSLLIANKYKSVHWGVRIFFEVADLRECFIEQPKSLASKITTRYIANIEKKLFGNVDFLVLTSKKYYDLHYYKIIDNTKVIYMPNVPETEHFLKYKKKPDGKFTVGFIGGLRYLSQMKMLVDAAEIADCNVLFAGASFSADDYAQITNYCKDKDFVTFINKYVYNCDIADLYGMIDCVYSVYDADNANVRIALPNKLYEAVYCELPIIVAKGTYLSDTVNEWGIGISVSHTNANECVAALKRLKNDSKFYLSKVNGCKENKYRIDLDFYNRSIRSCLQQEKTIQIQKEVDARLINTFVKKNKS